MWVLKIWWGMPVHTGILAKAKFRRSKAEPLFLTVTCREENRKMLYSMKINRLTTKTGNGEQNAWSVENNHHASDRRWVVDYRRN